MTALDQLFRVVEEIEAEVEETTTDRFPINGEMLLLQMPATRTISRVSGGVLSRADGPISPDDQSRQRLVCPELVILPVELEIYLSTNGVI